MQSVQAFPDFLLNLVVRKPPMVKIVAQFHERLDHLVMNRLKAEFFPTRRPEPEIEKLRHGQGVEDRLYRRMQNLIDFQGDLTLGSRRLFAHISAFSC